MAGKANGDGSIMLRKDGRWMGRYWVTLPNGNRKRQHIIKKDRDEVVRLMREEMSKADKGTPIYKDRNRTVKKMAEYWMSEIDPKISRPNTQHGHAQVMRKHIIPALGDIPLSSLKPEQVRRFINELIDNGVGVRTVQRVHDTLSACLREAVKLDYITRNVVRLVDKPKMEKTERKIWTSDQVTEFLNSCQDHKYYPMFLLLFHYGLRRGELLGLRWQDIDFNRDEIRIRQQYQQIDNKRFFQPPKTKAGRRDLPMMPEIREALEAHRRNVADIEYNDDLVFHGDKGNPVNPISMLRTFHYLSYRAGLPRLSLHEARHTVATLFKDLGIIPKEAQMILGHSSIYTTLDIYTHSTTQSKSKALETIAGCIFS